MYKNFYDLIFNNLMT